MGIQVTDSFCVFCGEPIHAHTALSCCRSCSEMGSTEMLNLLTALNDLRRLYYFYRKNTEVKKMTIKEEFQELFTIAHTKLTDINRVRWFSFLFDMLATKMTDEDIEAAKAKLKELTLKV